MTSTLFPLALNELLGFVRRDHSAAPDLSTFDSIIQRLHRRLAIQFSFASALDVSARLTAFKKHWHSIFLSRLTKIQDC
jgi:hypothetical protein